MRRSAMAAFPLLALIVSLTPTTAQGTTKNGLLDLRPGEGWVESPSENSKGVEKRAWSDPAAGCFLTSLETALPKKASYDILLAALIKQLEQSGTTLTPTSERSASDQSSSEPSAPKESTATGQTIEVAELSLLASDVTGVALLSLHTLDVSKKAQLHTCYWNQREPVHCQAVCKKVMKKLSYKVPAP